MLPVWIVHASNFDLNIPECHIRDSSLSLRFYWSTVLRHETITVSISICITDPYSCECHLCAFVRMCASARVCIRTCEFKCPIEYVKIYRSSGTFDTHSSLAIFDEHLVW